jgi:tetratricopeptide (TPR) repeat protein
VGACLDGAHEKGASRSDAAWRWTLAALQQAPPRALMLVTSDALAAGTLYARALGDRPDVLALARQHLWDSRYVAAQLGRRGETGSHERVLRAASLRAAVLWEPEPDGGAPPQGTVAQPAAPLHRLAAAGAATVPGPAAPLSPRQVAAAVIGILGDVGHDGEARRTAANAFDGLARHALQTGDRDSAEALWRAAAGAAPDHTPSLVNVGVARSLAGDLRGALEWNERALALAPDRVPALLNSGRYRRALGDTAGARARYRRVLALDPRNGAARKALEDLLGERSAVDPVRDRP